MKTYFLAISKDLSKLDTPWTAKHGTVIFAFSADVLLVLLISLECHIAQCEEPTLTLS